MNLLPRTLLATAAITLVSLLHAEPAKDKAAGAKCACAEGGVCACEAGTCTCSADAKKDHAAKGHPLKGVIVDVLAERGGLLVKHEEIPGVMKAMTMLLKVDAETLKTAKKGQAITGLLVKQDDGWHLTDVKPATS